MSNNKVKGKKFCPECGAENREDSLFCKECGSQLIQNLEKKKFTNSGICPNCGLINEPESSFCRECGTIFEFKTINNINKTKKQLKTKKIDFGSLLIGFFAGLIILFLILGNLLSYFVVPLIGSFTAAYLAERKSKSWIKIGIYTGALLNIVAALLSELIRTFLTLYGMIGVGMSFLTPSPFNGFSGLLIILLILTGSALLGAIIGIFGGLIGNFTAKKIGFDQILEILNNLSNKVRSNKR